MVDYTVNDIVGLSASQQPLQVAQAFDSVMRAKLADRLADFQDQFTQAAFQASPEEELDLDDDDLDIDDDAADDDGDSDDEFELLDLDDEDLDLEDLEDLDLDLEDDSDEDA